MRWLRLNCILLTSLAILSAAKAESSRHKRDLSYVKNFIKSAIFGRENKTDPALVLVNSGENYKIFRIPGFNNVLVKAVPKVTEAVAVPEKVELVSSEDSKVGIVASYLGTKTEGETLNAFQGVKDLLASGVLTATKDQAVPVGSLPPHLQLIAVGEGTFENPHILLDTSTICDDVQADEKPVVIQQPTIWQGHPLLSIFQRPIPFPTIFKPISPVKVPVPALTTKYSYKQIHGDGKVTTYTANDDHNVIVSESEQPGPLPPVVTYRIQEVMKLGAQGMQDLATIPVFAGNIQRPLVQYFTSPKVNPYRPVVSTVGNNYSYQQYHNDGTVTSYSSGQKRGDVVLTEGGKVPAIPTFITHRIENVAASAATGKQPNPVVLSGLNVPQSHWYNPIVYGHQMADTKGGVQVNVNTKGQTPTQQNQFENTGSQGTHSYQTIHKDGSVTNYGVASSVSSNPEKAEIKPISPLFIEDRLQTIAKTSGGSFSYKILHNDGSVTNYGVFGVHEEKNGGSKIVPVQKAKPGLNQQAISGHKGQANKETEDKGTGGYSYKIAHSDGSVTSYSSDGVAKKNEKGLENQFQGFDLRMINNGNLNNQQNMETFSHNKQRKNGQQATSAVNYADKQLTTGDIKSSELPIGSFSYKTVHTDGSVTVYSQNGVSEINEQQKNIDINKSQPPVLALGISERGKQNVRESIRGNAGVTFNKQDLKQNNQVIIQNSAVSPSSLFSYKAIHNDGSATIYSQTGVKEENKPFKNEKNASPNVVNVKQPGNNQYIEGSVQPNYLNHQAGEQNLHKSSHNNFGSGYGSFSYKEIHNNGSTTTYLQNQEKENAPLISENQLSSSAAVVDNREGSQKDQLRAQNNAVSAPESFSYKTVHNDGSSTIYSQNGVKEQNVALINKNQQSAGSTDLINQQKNIQQNAQVQNVVIPVPGSFSYKTVHNDGSMTIYSQNGVKEEKTALKNENIQSSSAASINQDDKQYLKASAPKNSGEQSVKHNIQVSSYNSAPESFSYKAVHSDGSSTIYSENGVKEDKRVFRNKNIQPKDVNQQNNHVSAQNIVVPVSGSFSYKAIHNDGAFTTYSQNGVKDENGVLKNEHQQSASVAGSNNYQNGNSQNLQANAVNNAGTAFNEQAVKQNIHVTAQNSASGSFSYKTVHKDGSTTLYSQNGVKEDNAPSSGTPEVNQQRKNQNNHVSAQNIVVPVSTSFSYKAVHNNGSMTTYTQSGVKPEIDAKETHIDDIKYYQAQKPVKDAKVNVIEQHLHTNQQNKGTPSPSSFLYKAVHSDGSETKYSGQGVEEIKSSSHNNPVDALSPSNLSNKQDKVTEEMNVHTNPQYVGKPSGSFSYKTIHSDGSESTMQSGFSQQNVKHQDQSSNTFDDKQKANQIIPPAPELPELSSNDLQVTPVGVLVADSNKVLFTKPVVSSYTYKQINHHSPDQFQVAVNIGDAASTESEFKVLAQVAADASMNVASSDDTISKDYVYIPPENVNEPLPIKPLVPNEAPSTEKPNPPSVVVLAPVDVVPCVEKSLSEHPIVVLDEPMKYSYQQRKADGSALHVESDQSVVSVNISSKERVRSRGDIPESP